METIPMDKRDRLGGKGRKKSDIGFLDALLETRSDKVDRYVEDNKIEAQNDELYEEDMLKKLEAAKKQKSNKMLPPVKEESSDVSKRLLELKRSKQ